MKITFQQTEIHLTLTLNQSNGQTLYGEVKKEYCIMMVGDLDGGYKI